MNTFKPSTGDEPNEIKIEPIVSVKRQPSIIIETISSTGEKVVYDEAFEKREIVTKVPIPEGHIRAIVLRDFDGMEDKLFSGDVVDLPGRRFKTLSNRGYVREYEGTRIPNKDR